ncbi:MAG: TrkH family potassium uptake protein [Pelagibacteraceae bacterium]|jgi:trk system potassium uptake protein TrkH|nr:TrkH family potassium uptake protein [Pelagibacteraceae bacterium]|tara:strand:- start:458 stop:1906 length:1449 start_codon:yes stop_codon:yes gene_type:complete
MTNYKTVFFVLGILLIILGFFMIAPIMVQLIYEDGLDGTFVYSSIVTIFMGILFLLSNLDQDRKLNLQQAFLLTSLSWIGIAIFGSLPFILSDLELTFSDAFFESMSGITTTGSTVIGDLSNVPKAILIWRSLLQWLGGIGIVVMAITVLPLLNVGGMQLFKLQSGDTTEKILPRTREIAFKIILIYFFLSSVCAVSYFFVGMNVFDSIAHAMTTIATGGFSTYSESIGYFQNPKIEIVSIIFIISGSIPFIAYLKYLDGNKKIFFQDTQIKGLIYICLISIIIITLNLLIKEHGNFFSNLRLSAFNVVSILSGTGYVTTNFNLWGNFSLVFFLLLMFIGGCAGSTACGIKVFRIQILWLFIINEIKKSVYPRGVFPLSYNKEKIDKRFISPIISFIFLYFLIFFLVAMLLSFTGLDFITSFSGAATAISNVGPGLGDMIGPSGNFSELSNFAKWILSFAMLLGRLEIFTLLVLFFPGFWKN